MSEQGEPRGLFGEIGTAMFYAEAHPFSDRFGNYRPSVTLNDYADVCHHIAKETGWWTNLDGTPKERNKGELLLLIITEICEAAEGLRKDLMDDKLPKRKMVEVELADALIRIFDFAGGYGLDLEGALREKLSYNKSREDHRPENRAKEGGKAW